MWHFRIAQITFNILHKSGLVGSFFCGCPVSAAWAGTIMVVLGMLRWKCPPLLILLVLLIRWNDQVKHSIDPFAWISNFHVFIYEKIPPYRKTAFLGSGHGEHSEDSCKILWIVPWICPEHFLGQEINVFETSHIFQPYTNGSSLGPGFRGGVCWTLRYHQCPSRCHLATNYFTIVQ